MSYLGVYSRNLNYDRSATDLCSVVFAAASSSRVATYTARTLRSSVALCIVHPHHLCCPELHRTLHVPYCIQVRSILRQSRPRGALYRFRSNGKSFFVPFYVRFAAEPKTAVRFPAGRSELYEGHSPTSSLT